MRFQIDIELREYDEENKSHVLFRLLESVSVTDTEELKTQMTAISDKTKEYIDKLKVYIKNEEK